MSIRIKYKRIYTGGSIKVKITDIHMLRHSELPRNYTEYRQSCCWKINNTTMEMYNYANEFRTLSVGDYISADEFVAILGELVLCKRNLDQVKFFSNDELTISI